MFKQRKKQLEELVKYFNGLPLAMEISGFEVRKGSTSSSRPELHITMLSEKRWGEDEIDPPTPLHPTGVARSQQDTIGEELSIQAWKMFGVAGRYFEFTTTFATA